MVDSRHLWYNENSVALVDRHIYSFRYKLWEISLKWAVADPSGRRLGPLLWGAYSFILFIHLSTNTLRSSKYYKSCRSRCVIHKFETQHLRLYTGRPSESPSLPSHSTPLQDPAGPSWEGGVPASQPASPPPPHSTPLQDPAGSSWEGGVPASHPASPSHSCTPLQDPAGSSWEGGVPATKEGCSYFYTQVH
jgi:hypothetical protein